MATKSKKAASKGTFRHVGRHEEQLGSCTRCNSSIRSFESISVAGQGVFCHPCFNDDTAAAMGVRFDNARFEPLTLRDRAGRPHTFHIRSMLVPTGHEMEALEIQGVTARGYRFRILGGFEDDTMGLFGKLYARMRAGLARQHVKRGDYGWQLTDDHRVTARIEADLEDDARRPLLVIDGKEFTWDQVGHMLMTFEGFTVDMTVRDTIEVVGGPLAKMPRTRPRRRRT